MTVDVQNQLHVQKKKKKYPQRNNITTSARPPMGTKHLLLENPKKVSPLHY